MLEFERKLDTSICKDWESSFSLLCLQSILEQHWGCSPLWHWDPAGTKGKGRTLSAVFTFSLTQHSAHDP